jgi:putative transposase
MAHPSVRIKEAQEDTWLVEVQEDTWLVSFMDYDLGYFDLETSALEPLENPCGPKLSPM